jgi:threonyl-tRNA synthetase
MAINNELRQLALLNPDLSLDYDEKAVLDFQKLIEQPKVNCGLSYMDALVNLGFVSRESASDKGHFRYYPHGALALSLISDFLEMQILEELNAYAVRTPFLFKIDDSGMSKQAGIFFDDRVYHAQPSTTHEDSFILRFNGDVGQFHMLKDAQLTEKQLPFRMYETVRGFRYTLSGELSGIRRGRTFTFPDIHSICANIEQATEEYRSYCNFQNKLNDIANLDLKFKFKTTREFFDRSQQLFRSILAENGSSALIEFFPTQRQYWSMKHIAYTGGEKLIHVQFDTDNTSNYGINYIGNDGKTNDCVIIHASIGSIEKWLVIAVENALRMEKPTLPTWLCPTQVRLIPIDNKRHLDYCAKLANQISEQKIRVDVDDRKYGLGQKIKSAEQNWIPYILVIGDKEMEGDSYQMRTREDIQPPVTRQELINEIKTKTFGKPFRPLAGLLLSKRPIFR